MTPHPKANTKGQSTYPDVAYAPELKELEMLLLREWNEREPSPPSKNRAINIYCWRMKGVGLRVAEVSMSQTNASGAIPGVCGCSFMQSDTETVPFLCERWVLDRRHFVGTEESSLEDIQAKLVNAIFGPDTNQPCAV